MPTNINNTYLPLTTSLQQDENSEIKKIPYSNNHIDVIYTPKAILKTNETPTIILNKKFGKNTYCIWNKNTNSFIKIYNDDTTLFETTIPLLHTAEFYTKGCVLIKGSTINNKTFCLIFDTKKEKIVLCDEYESFEENRQTIKFLKFCNDIAGHGIVNVFDINSCCVDNYVVYINNSPKTATNNQLIPFAFLESIKLKDFTLAKHYLYDSLTSNEHLENFFGDFSDIYFNGYSNKLNYTIKGKKYRNFTFELNNNKIIDIEENDLSI